MKKRINPNIVFISITVVFFIFMGFLSIQQIKENKDSLLEVKYLFFNKILTQTGKVGIKCHITLKFKRNYNSTVLDKVCEEAETKRPLIENDIIAYMSAQKPIFYQKREDIIQRQIRTIAEHIIKKYISQNDAIESIKITHYSVVDR